MASSHAGQRRKACAHCAVDGVGDGTAGAAAVAAAHTGQAVGIGQGVHAGQIRRRRADVAADRRATGHTGKLAVIELDRDLAARLRLRDDLDVVESDVLKVDFRALAARLGVPKLRVVGNLPYNISSPILFHLLEQVDVVQDQHFMLQKEVIDRMVADAGNSAYGRLSVMLQWRYAMEDVLFVPPGSFNPPPKVDSAVVRMIPREKPAELNPQLLEELVRVAFSQRRKILRNTLGKWLEEKGFAGEFDLQRRAEEVPVAEYEALAAQFS